VVVLALRLPAQGGVAIAGERLEAVLKQLARGRVQPGLGEALFDAVAGVGVSETGDAAPTADHGDDNAGEVKNGGDLARERPAAAEAAGLGEVLGQLEQFEGRIRMVQQVAKALEQEALGGSRQPEPGRLVPFQADQVHLDGRGELVPEDGGQFVGIPEAFIARGIEQRGHVVGVGVQDGGIGPVHPRRWFVGVRHKRLHPLLRNRPGDTARAVENTFPGGGGRVLWRQKRLG